MNKQAFLAAAMLSAIGMSTAIGLWVAGMQRESWKLRRIAILIGGLFLGVSGLLMWYFAQAAQSTR